MNLLLSIVLFSFLYSSTFELSDGTKVSGEILSETETEIVVKTSYGEITLSKDEIIYKIFKVVLKTGEVYMGEKEIDNDELISIKTKFGTIEINRLDILEITEISSQTSASSEGLSDYNEYLQNYQESSLFGSFQSKKDIEYSSGDKELTDLFFGPTANTLKQSTFYLSGLSFGFGITDKIMISSRWFSYFYGDMNLRPKIKLYDNGNIDSRTTFAVGAHYHNRWNPGMNWGDTKYEWLEGTIDINEGQGEPNNKYYGAYYTLSDTPGDEYWNYNGDDGYEWGGGSDDEYSSNNFFNMIEIFTAFTKSLPRGNLKGQISHTVGANIQYVVHDITHNNTERDNLYYKIYYGLDIDVTPQIKMIGQVFYDPYYIPWYIIQDYDESGDLNLYDNPVEKPSLLPIHFDFGFLYSVTNTLRVGVHFQPTYVGFYWEL